MMLDEIKFAVLSVLAFAASFFIVLDGWRDRFTGWGWSSACGKFIVAGLWCLVGFITLYLGHCEHRRRLEARRKLREQREWRNQRWH